MRTLTRGNLPKQIVKLMSDRISSGQYKRGDKLPTEQSLINEFGVSRTVVREAIANLKAAGMVSTHQGVGAFVLHQAPLTPFWIEEASLGLINEAVAVLELRIGIESEAAALAAIRRDESHIAEMKNAMATMATVLVTGADSVGADLHLHRTIALATGNRHYLRLFTQLGELLIPRTKLQTFKLSGATREEYLDRVNREHEQIVTSIEQGDPEGARAAMRIHLIGSKERLRAGARNKVV